MIRTTVQRWIAPVLSASALAASIVLAVPAAATPPAPALDITGSTPAAVGAVVDLDASAPIQTSGAGTQTIEQSWDSSEASLSGVVSGPDGWTIEYTTDDGATWSGTAPANLGDATGVRAIGSVNSDGESGGRQVYVSHNSVADDPSFAFENQGGGDGYDVVTTANYVLNVFHHSFTMGQQLTLSCHLRTGESCSSPTFTVTDASVVSGWLSNAVVIGTKLWVTASKDSGMSWRTVGVQCIDITALPFSDCGFQQIYNSADSLGQPGNIAVDGNKLYFAAGATDGAQTLRLFCWDTLAMNNCSRTNGLPLSSSTDTDIKHGAFTSVINGKIYVVGKKVWCRNAANLLLGCSGFTNPQSIVDVGTGLEGATVVQQMVPMRDNSGTITGACLIANGTIGPKCVNTSGVDTPLPSGLATMLADHPLSGMVDQGFAMNAFNGNRQYWVYVDGGVGQVACYDWIADAACDGFASPSIPESTYAITVDPTDANCMWGNADSGEIFQFADDTGIPTCVGSPEVGAALSAVGGTGCGASADYAWGEIRLTDLAGVDPTGFTVQVLDSAGVAITGYDALTPDSSGVIDISGLTAADTGATPRIRMLAVAATEAEALAFSVDVTYTADFPHLCYSLEVLHDCPTAVADAYASDSLTVPALQVRSHVVEEQGGTTVAESVIDEPWTRQNMTGCTGALAGHVRTSGGDAVAGRTVELLSPSGQVLASVSTDANGAYSFPYVGAVSGYRVRVAAQTKTGAVTAGSTTQVDFVEASSGGNGGGGEGGTSGGGHGQPQRPAKGVIQVPRSIPLSGRVFVMKLHARTQAGQLLTASATCMARVRGSLDLCGIVKVAHGKNAGYYVRTEGVPVTLTITWHAPRDRHHRAYLKQEVYRVG